MYKELLRFLFKPNQRVEAAAPHCSDTFISPKSTWQFVFLKQLQTLFIQLPSRTWEKNLTLVMKVPFNFWWKCKEEHQNRASLTGREKRSFLRRVMMKMKYFLPWKTVSQGKVGYMELENSKMCQDWGIKWKIIVFLKSHLCSLDSII